jgi:L-amino acid N-acyltransferase YncA
MKAGAASSDSNKSGLQDEGVRINNFEVACEEPTLMDWEGNWLPAPVEWESRKGFHHRNFYQWIDEWIDDMLRTYMLPQNKFAVEPNMEIFLAKTNGAVVSLPWVPRNIENQPPSEFWRRFPQFTPKPIWEEDLHGEPWWELLGDHSTLELPAIEVPECRIDQQGETAEAYADDYGSADAMDRYNRRTQSKAKKEKQERREFKKKMKQIELDTRILQWQAPPPDVSICPRLNIFLRPMEPTDLVQMKDIYNWHLKNSLFSPEDEEITFEGLQQRLSGILETFEGSDLFCVVAIERGRRLHYRRVAARQEHIAGFAYVNDYSGKRSIYKHSVELKIFVESSSQRKGIATCLLDKMLHLMDLSYSPRSGYQFISEDNKYIPLGGTRKIGTVLVSIPYYQHEPAYREQMRDWLDRFNFKMCGDIEISGIKNGNM